MGRPCSIGQIANLSQDDSSPRIGRDYEGGPLSRNGEVSASSSNQGSVGFKMLPGARRVDAGSAARFFYCAKGSRQDRSEGWASSSSPAVSADATMRDVENADWATRNGNHHPTMKLTDLMRYLCRR
jgi:site-specific DNA-methyltransferase (adenine-specific)